MIIELIDNYSLFQTVPAYIDFSSIGSRDIEPCLKSYLDCNSDELRTLLAGNFITLFIDNYNPTEANKNICAKLYRFVKDNSVRIIATHDTELNNGYDTTFASLAQIAFETKITIFAI